MVVTYNEVKTTFEERGCKLLMTEDEFNLKPRKVKEKYKYIASYTHEHKVLFHSFKRTLSRDCPKFRKRLELKGKIENSVIFSLSYCPFIFLFFFSF